MFNKEIFAKAEEELRSLRAEEVIDADMRRAEVQKRSKRLCEIDAELSGIGIRVFRSACAREDITAIKNRNLALQKERREELKKLGYPENYTDVHYTCKDCEDSGYVGLTMCRCLRKKLVETAIAATGMGRLIGKQTFANFDLSSYQGDDYENNKNTLDALKKFVKDFPSQDLHTIVLMGKTGTGKTHLSSAIAGEIIEKGMDVRYDSFQNIATDFEHDKFRSGYAEVEPISNGYLTCDLLIVDDLGAEFTTSFTVTCLYHILTTRQNKGLATVFSTNLGSEEICEIYTDRIFSRFCAEGAKILQIRGKDRRVYR